MGKTNRYLSAVSAVLMAAVLATPVHAFEGRGKVQPALLEKIEQAGNNRGLAKGRNHSEQEPAEPGDEFAIIVSLDSGRFAAGTGRAMRQPAERAALQAHIRSSQETVINSLPAQAQRGVRGRYQTVPGFSGRFNAAQIERLARHPLVTQVEAMPVHTIMAQQAHPLTGTDQVHSSGFTGKGAVIAVIDDGIDHRHDAFGGHSSFPNAKIIGGYDFADYDADPTIDCDAQSHGTAVAGVALGNGGGVLGSAPDAKMVMLKVQHASDCGKPRLAGDIIGAIDWVVANKDTYGIDIINMSLGGGLFADQCDSSSYAYRTAMENAEAAGLIILAASGNEGMCDQLSRPACLSRVISVGAVYDADVGSPGFCVSSGACGAQSFAGCGSGYACFENGTNADKVTCYSNSASFLDLLAPSNCATTAQAGGGTNNCFSGTSSATPYAAGVAASLIEAAGGSGVLDNNAMRSLLADNGVTINDPKSLLSTPRVDAQASLQALNSGQPGPGAELDNGVAVSGLSGAAGSEQRFTFTVPEGAEELLFTLSGGSGDADLYVRYGNEPTLSEWDCRPYLVGNNEQCSIATPQAGTYHVLIQGYSSYADASLLASYQQPQADNVLVNGEAKTGLQGATGDALYYEITVPAGASNLLVAMSGGTGDADLYLRYGAEPSLSQWDCRPYQYGNEETCSVAAPQVGTYHVMIHGYSAFSGVSLLASHD